MSSAAALRDVTPSLLKAEVRWLLTLLSVTDQLARDLRVGEVEHDHGQDLALPRR